MLCEPPGLWLMSKPNLTGGVTALDDAANASRVAIRRSDSIRPNATFDCHPRPR
jgi:hypothetical protein